MGNTGLLLVVVAIAALVMAGGIGCVVIKTRAPKWTRAVRRDPVEKDALSRERERSLADEFIADARSAQVAQPPVRGPLDRTRSD
ncbi:hypothetical protein [Mycobacterium deserti]|uniref:Uncharacterized protein n=1 Tax=Mycobacterium deserti TaxID=2978347 RepID=A0ABT2M7W1_9MYCO|nr:hypothetical protein [Mycobacterium deserti]MCT7658356.1 hypothetical protein [Mycobacterium deserti]